LDVSIEEIKNVLKILKPNKSPGEDGIIYEFYITHWEQIKDEFFLLVNDTSVYSITSCIRRLASLILRPLTNPFWSECINFGKTTFNLSARIFAIIL
jgi:hypothetical protein